MCFGHQCVFSREMVIEDFSPYFDWVVCFLVIELHELFVYFVIVSSYNDTIMTNVVSSDNE